METFDVRNGNAFHRWLAAAALVAVSLGAQAATLSANHGLSSSVVGNTVSVFANGGAVGGDLMGVPAGTATTMQVPPGWATGHAAGGWPTMTASGKGPVPGTAKTVPVTTTVPLDKAATGKALARFAAKMAGPLAVGMHVYDLLNELGYKATWNAATGENEFSEVVPGSQCQAPTVQAYTNPTSWCQAVLSSSTAVGRALFVSATATNCQWKTECQNNGSSWTQYTSYSSPVLPNPTGTPRTEQELADKIAAQSGWPSTSAVSKALADALKAGATTATSPTASPTVSGVPSSVSMPDKVTTKQNADGTTTTTTEKTTINITMSGNTYTTTNNTTTITTTYNPVSNTTTNEGTTTQSITPDEKPPEDPCKANPDRVGCKELGEPSDEELPKKDVTVTYQAESLGFGGGSCPAPYTWSDSLGSHSINLQPLCDKLVAIVRPLVIAFALLAAYFIIGGFKAGD